MSTLTGDDLPAVMADAISDFGPDLDETAIVYLLAAGPHFLLSELVDHADEAREIAEMKRKCERDLAQLRADIAADMAR